MNLDKKGWLSTYIELKENEFSQTDWSSTLNKGMHPDQSLYSIIQPTGIMYGYPVKDVGEGATEDHDARIKVLLLDTLISSYLLFTLSSHELSPNIRETLEAAVSQIGRFYNSVYEELYTGNKSFFGKKRTDIEVVEKIIDKRISGTKGGNFWSLFFHNSLLFLDIYFFRQWVQTGDDKLITNYLKSQKDDLRVDVVKVMAAAAHANLNIEQEERKLFEYFIGSLSLPSDRKKEAKEFFEVGVTLEDVPTPSDDSWILKKYFLELGILTAWADRKVESLEYEFLKQFNERLGFSDDDFENSMIAVEGFVLDYWTELDKLQSKQDFDKVSQEYIHRLSRAVRRYHDRLYQEVYQRGSLLKLLKKAKVSDLTESEEKHVREELIAAMQSLPVFQIISLPKNFLSLKILMQILPDDFFKNLN